MTAVVALGTFVIGAAAVAPTASASSSTQVDRLAGSDAVDTAAKVSQHAWQTAGEGPDAPGMPADAVVLTRNDHFGDGLVGAPLASSKNGPLLLTSPNFLSGAAEQEIRRILPAGKTVYILGGTLAVSPDVENRVRALGYQVSRVWGATQYETAIAIADAANVNPGNIFVATGREYYDALAAGATAGGANGVVLLSDGPNLPWAVYDYINRHPNADVYGVGGPAVAALQYGPRDYYALSGERRGRDRDLGGRGLEQGLLHRCGHRPQLPRRDVRWFAGRRRRRPGAADLAECARLRSYAFLNRNAADLYEVDLYGGTMAPAPQVQNDVVNAVGAANAAPSLTARSAAPADAQPRDAKAAKPEFTVPADAKPVHPTK
ncbi:cell wall-binding repeat-containing protein [Yinghuangia aomiensis]